MERKSDEPGAGPPEPRPAEPGDAKRRRARLAEALRRTDESPAVLRAVRATRQLLPGDPKFGDEVSTAGGRPTELLARHLTERGETRDSATREVGLTALQVWQAVSQAAGRGAGTEGVAILFTDLVGFSTWVLEVGDDVALELLREVSDTVEPAIKDNGGRLVKRLGDGHMAAFGDAESGVAAALDIQERLDDVEVEGYQPKLRTGVHLGRPRKLGDDYLGTDVNIAARLAEAGEGGEVLVTDAALQGLDTADLDVKRKRWFRAKGTPRELQVYAVSRSG